jgi:hypothetical protein
MGGTPPEKKVNNQKGYKNKVLNKKSSKKSMSENVRF